MGTRWPLTGRSDELDQLSAALRDPACRGVVLAGEAGVGKTRLAAELVERADGWHAVKVMATRSLGTVSMGAFAHVLPSGRPAGYGDLMRLLRTEFRARGQVLLSVDDAHLLDPASAAAVHMLSATGSAFVVATVRSREPAPDAITALWRTDYARRVELQPLSREETVELLSAALNGQVDSVTGHRLWQATRGNVLFLHELVLAGRAAGRLTDDTGVWAWHGEITFSDRLTELIDDRLAGLTPLERATVETLAVGEPLGPAFLPGSLESLETRQLISATQDGARIEVRLAHPLYAEAVRTQLGALCRRAIQNELAGRLAEFGARRRGDLLRLATWQLAAGGPLDTATLLSAARQARAVLDHRLTEQFARAAGNGLSAQVLLADALYWQGKHQDALAVLASVADDPAAEIADRVWRLIVTASVQFWGLDDIDAAEQVLRAGEQVFGRGPERAELAAHRATMVMFNGRPAEAISIAEPLLGASTDITQFRALAAMVPALSLSGRADQAIMAAKTGITVAGGIVEDEPWGMSMFRAGLALAYWLSGCLDELHQLAVAAHAAAVRKHADDRRGLWALLLGRAALAMGRPATARTHLREAAGLLRRSDDGGFLAWCLASQARASIMLGDHEDAEAAMVESRQRRRAAIRTDEVELVLAEAWLAESGGERTRAVRLVGEAARLAASRGQYAMEMLALHESMRLGVLGTARRLTQLESIVDGPMARVVAAHSRALARGDGPGLDAAADGYASLGATLAAAEAAVQAARAYVRAGQTSAQVGALAKGRALAATCEGAWTPVLRDLALSPELDALTSREREVAELAARGLTNREIADRLVLSVRTVGNHLNHVYGKLSVTREDLPGLLGP